MENVKALATLEKWGDVRQRYLDKAASLGYKCHFFVLNATEYGVSQKRERVFFIGIRNDYEYDNDKMYWVDIAPKGGLYYVQEAVYEPQGILAQNDEYDVVYYQKNNILSKENEKRVLGNIFEFTYDEDVEDECETIDEEYYELNDSLKGDWTVETLEDCNCNECLAEKIEHLYAIIDELDKRVEELELKSEGKKDKSASDVDALETMELLLDYLAEYC